MSDCHENKHTDELTNKDCTATTYQSAEISVPITVRPKVNTGIINTFCCGEPKVKPSPCKITCDKSGNCSYILTQQICIEIPIEFSTDAFAGCPYIECGKASTGMCEDCGG